MSEYGKSTLTLMESVRVGDALTSDCRRSGTAEGIAGRCVDVFGECGDLYSRSFFLSDGN
jgi:hypothetical protein